MGSDTAVEGEISERKILVDCYDITSESVDSLRRQIGAALESPTIFSGTIRSNISVRQSGPPGAGYRGLEIG